jgi:hypothetical protein
VLFRPAALVWNLQARSLFARSGGFRQPARERPATLIWSAMNMTLRLGPIAALIAGILILVMPGLLNYIVAIYLIIVGLSGLVGSGSILVP